MRSLPRKFQVLLAGLAVAVLILGGAVIALALRDSGGASTTSSKSAATSTSTTGKGYLGLTVTALATEGLRVTSVEKDGPAAQAGILTGDVIRSVDGKVVRTPEQLKSAVEAKAPGTKVQVTFDRGDNEQQAQVKLGDEPANAQIEATPQGTGSAGVRPGRGPGNAPGLMRRGLLGIQIQEITPALKQQYNLTTDAGIVVTNVNAGSAAASAGLQAGDVIESVNDKPISSLTDLTTAIASATAGQALSIKVLRGSAEQTIQVTLPQAAQLPPAANNLPQVLKDRLQQMLDDGTLTQDQLQELLANGLRNQGLRVGQVKQVSDTSLTLTPLAGGADVTVALTDKTEYRRGNQTIGLSDLANGETVIVISLDGGQTASAVMSLGQQQSFR